MALFCYRALPCPNRSDRHAGFAHRLYPRCHRALPRYVVIDTQSDPASPTCPSTEKQKDLGRLLASELQALGLVDAHLDGAGMSMRRPANTAKQVPVSVLRAHRYLARLHRRGREAAGRARNYHGGDIVLLPDHAPLTGIQGGHIDAPVIRAADDPALADQIGHDITSTDGTSYARRR